MREKGKLRVSYIQKDEDLIEYVKPEETDTSFKKKKTLMICCLISTLFYCLISLAIIITVLIIYGLVNSSVIPWGRNFCIIRYTINNQQPNVTSKNLFNSYYTNFNIPPFGK